MGGEGNRRRMCLEEKARVVEASMAHPAVVGLLASSYSSQSELQEEKRSTYTGGEWGLARTRGEEQGDNPASTE